MFLVIPEASNALKWMFFDALVIQEPSQIDPGSIWEKSFFHENFSFRAQKFASFPKVPKLISIQFSMWLQILKAIDDI